MTGFLYHLVAFVVALGALIVVHEFGHYLVARLAGVKVLRFSVGFGRPVFSKQIGPDGTEWALGIFPLGGYVKMLDEREGEVLPAELPRSFSRQNVWRRMAIVAAGPLFNFLFAILIYWGLFMNGQEELLPVLGSPVAESPAFLSGVMNGERVLKVGGTSVQTWQEMRWELLRQAVDQESIDIEVVNQKNEVNIRRLSLASVKANDWNEEALEKLGIRFYRPLIAPVIGNINRSSPAMAAGLLAGDEVLAINSNSVGSWFDVVQVVRASPGKPLQFEVKRNNDRFYLEITPATFKEASGNVGQIGVTVRDLGFEKKDLMITVRYDIVAAFEKSVSEAWDKSVFSLLMMGKIIVGKVSWHNISGPVTIADYAGQSAKLGLGYYLNFIALVSLSLAVLNLLPIPILDGGHLLYYVLEIIRGKPLSERTMEVGQQIGLALMLMLMTFALYNDVNRLISG